MISEHDEFTAINGVRINGKLSRCACWVNDSKVAYLKYASKPGYRFTFHDSHFEDLKHLRAICDKVFIALICLEDREICCFEYDGTKAIEPSVLATLEPHYWFKLFGANDDNQVPRNAFPIIIFQ